MPVQDNAHIAAIKKEQINTYVEGMNEGERIEQLPPWYYTKTLVQLSVWERGYWFGRELKQFSDQ